MKSNLSAVDATARWAEVSCRRKEMPLLNDLLGIQEDKSEACPPPRVTPKKRVAAEAAISDAAARKSAKAQDIQTSDPEAPKSANGSEKKKPDDFQQAKLKDMKAATWTSRTSFATSSTASPMEATSVTEVQKEKEKALKVDSEPAASAASPEAAGHEAKGSLNRCEKGEGKAAGPVETAAFSEQESKAWEEFVKKIGPDWRKRFAAQTLKRLEKLDKKPGLKDKKDKRQEKKKDKKDKKEKKEKKDKAHKKEKEKGKEKKQKNKKRPLEDDDDAWQRETKGANNSKPSDADSKKEAAAAKRAAAAAQRKATAAAKAAEKASAKAAPKAAAKAKAESKKAAAKAEGESKAASKRKIATAPNPPTAAGLAASLKK